MEGNDWYNPTGYTDYRNHYRGDERPIDQDVFRGAYRFDNESRNRNETTYDGFDRRGRRHDDSRSNHYMQDNYNSGQSYYYNDNRNQDRDRNRDGDWNSNNRQNSRQQGYWMDEETHQPESLHRSTHVSGNFEDRYNRDRYNNYGDDRNYGNMAGSLSYGYDGDYNADWDDNNRHYDPLTGHRRSYHGNYTSRHPEQDNTRNNRDFDRNRGNNYDPY